MVNNDRILANTANLLLALRGDQGATHTLAERSSRAELERPLDAFLEPWAAAVPQEAKAA